MKRLMVIVGAVFLLGAAHAADTDAQCSFNGGAPVKATCKGNTVPFCNIKKQKLECVDPKTKESLISPKK